MKNARRLGRLGMLAVGLGFGVAMAPTGVASADSTSADLVSLLSALDPFGAAAASPANIDISFDGYTLFNGGGTAVADTGTQGNGNFDFAIAEGAGAHATATGGMFDYASADGTNADAVAGGASGYNFDSATDIGTNSEAVGTIEGLAVDTQGAFAEGGSGNTAIDIGNNDYECSCAGEEGSVAGGLGEITGNNDEALTFGNLGSPGAGSFATDGNNDAASLFGNTTPDIHGVYAGLGNGDLASVVGTTSSASAGGAAFGFFDPTYFPGNNDVAYVFDPFGAAGSSAGAGSGFNAADTAVVSGNNDLAAAFGDALHPSVTGVSNMFEILPALFGDGTGSFAADGGNFLTDILSGLTF